MAPSSREERRGSDAHGTGTAELPSSNSTDQPLPVERMPEQPDPEDQEMACIVNEPTQPAESPLEALQSTTCEQLESKDATVNLYAKVNAIRLACEC